VNDGIAIVEISALGAALVILDQMEKAASVRLFEAELNDYYGFVLKIAGTSSALRSAVDVGQDTALRMRARFVSTIIDAPDSRARRGIESQPEHQPLIEQAVVFRPQPSASDSTRGAKQMPDDKTFAIGLIETQGFTAVIEAIDTACKAANVEVIGKEKLGGGYITVLVKGDVAAVTAAIDAGKQKVDGLGKLIAAHVIARPSESVLALLPRSN
jgi:microcompartment protein CcmL/EutN